MKKLVLVLAVAVSGFNAFAGASYFSSMSSTCAVSNVNIPDCEGILGDKIEKMNLIKAELSSVSSAQEKNMIVKTCRTQLKSAQVSQLDTMTDLEALTKCIEISGK